MKAAGLSPCRAACAGQTAQDLQRLPTSKITARYPPICPKRKYLSTDLPRQKTCGGRFVVGRGTNTKTSAMKTLLIKIGAFIVTLLAGVEGTNAGSPADSREATQVQESGLSFSKLEYRVSISSGEARVAAEVAVECDKKEPCSTVLFTGDLALLPLKLPKPLRIERIGDTYMLSVSRPGRYQFTVELVAKVKDFDPWKRITFKGPLAAIASVSAEAAGDAEVQLLTGAPVSNERSNGVARVKGFLGGEREVSIRWSSRDAPGEILRTAL